MKNKVTHYKTIHIKYFTHSDSLFKLEVYTFPKDEKLCEFFLPRKDNQRYIDIDYNAIVSRLKRDFFITFDHNSATYC